MGISVLALGFLLGGVDIESQFPRAYKKIKRSGCVEIKLGVPFGSREMNCVLNHYGIKERAIPGQLMAPTLKILEER